MVRTTTEQKTTGERTVSDTNTSTTSPLVKAEFSLGLSRYREGRRGGYGSIGLAFLDRVLASSKHTSVSKLRD